MVEQPNVEVPGARATGARARFSRAAARLRAALFTKRSRKQVAYQDALEKCRNRIEELELEMAAKDVMYKKEILRVTAEAEEIARADAEEEAALTDKIRCIKEAIAKAREELSLQRKKQKARRESDQNQIHVSPKEAMMLAEVESLKTVIELKKRELEKERKVAEQLRRVELDLMMAQQRTQAAEMSIKFLTAELRKHGEKVCLNPENEQPEEISEVAALDRLKFPCYFPRNRRLQY